MSRTAMFDELVDDWSDSGKCHPMALLYGLTEKEMKVVEGSTK